MSQHGGRIAVGQCNSRLRFEFVKSEKWNGRVGKIRTGICSDSNGVERYTIIEKLHEQSSFWIFKSGYTYYELQDKVHGKSYMIFDICFAADMHYYYVFNEQKELQAAIYKPYRDLGEGEYHIYAKADEFAEGLFFTVAYIEYFLYPYDYISDIHIERRELYTDDAAYQIFCDELLELYDENFTKEVILNA